MPKKTAKKSGRRVPASASQGRRRASAGSGAVARVEQAAHVEAQAAQAEPAARSRVRKRRTARTPRAVLEPKGVPALADPHGPVAAQLVVSSCDEAAEFYRRAFGARLVPQVPGPDDVLARAKIDVSGAVILLSEPVQTSGPARPPPRSASTGSVTLYVQDVDAAFRRAVEAGATARIPPQDQFWGDRFSQVEDPYGHVWSIATHLRDVTLEEMQAALAQMHTAEA